jgi:exodeoxyribonuclease VII small subunit
MTGKTRTTATKSKRTFEQAIAEVERIVARLEGGNLELAQSLDEYERGIGTLKECHELLQGAEKRITLLSGFDADGNPVTEPFEEAQMSPEQKQASRSKRRSEIQPKNPLLSDSLEIDDFDGEGSQDGLF